MKKVIRISLLFLLLFVKPLLSQAQLSGEIQSLHAVLDQLYTDMLPLCGQLMGVGRGLAGFAALWYIASRVWGHLARAEAIDFYPLFRPFVLGFAVMIFPSVIAMINGVMQPTVTGTAHMVTRSDEAVAKLLQQKEAAIKQSIYWQMYVGATGIGDRDQWYKYTHPDDNNSEGVFESIGNDMKFAMEKASYNFRNSIKVWLSEILQVLFQAAALCINTIRTFQLLVLAILGPLVFGLAVFDGFQHSLTVWIARYINTFLWLPIANIFGAILGKIQENMLKLDLGQIQDQGDTFFSATDIAYLVFMIIGIMGYWTVPSMANYIIHAGGGNALLQRVTSGFTSGTNRVVSTTATSASMVKDSFGNTFSQMQNGVTGEASNYFKDKIAGK